ncbi:hypothetical protein PAXRUDRAFT_833394 [Paxillus rubicundulus Ve08.2h10]|uniref:Glucose receptor Git3 N-terminal domain-containing protein n=1 Tax=Paxillus rubicundulus Ve08.2h10 TaxID=930991 RepID=A0A0D0DH21_9AGAM|nr:hypothetical protein PAXRUDRAFT_833394 [Paxillus rubicundulus Ve08.2h10]
MSTVMTFEPLSSAQSRGLIIVAVFALLSALALTFIAFRTIRLVIIPVIQGHNNTYRAPENLFSRTQLGHYAASLVFSNAFISAAGLIEFSWVSRSGLSQGLLCSTQAVLMQIGIWSTCFFMVALGLHTCNSLVFRIRQVTWLSSVVVAIGWTIAFVSALAPMKNNNLYGPTGISCSITSAYPTEIFVLEALPIILGAVLSAVIYSLIYLVLYGNLSTNGGLRFNIKPQGRWSALHGFEEYHRFIGAIAQTMFWYPFAFTFFLLPFCLTHLLMYNGNPVSYALDAFAHVCCVMLGFVNVGLLYNTFRVISPVFHGPPNINVVVQTEDTFGNDTFDESPVLPQPAYMSKGPVIPLYQANDQLRNCMPSLHQHSRSSSESSTNSSTQLLSIKRKSSKYNKMRIRQPNHLPPLPSFNIVPPAEPSLQLDVANGSISRRSSGKGRELRITLPPMSEAEAPSPPLVTVSLTPAPRSPCPAGAEFQREPPIKAFKRLSRHTTEAFGKIGKKSSFKFKAPSALNLPPIPASPSLLYTREVTNKSATIAVRLGLPVSSRTEAFGTEAFGFAAPHSASIRPLPSANIPVRKLDKGKGKAPAPPATPMPRISVTSLSPSSIRLLPRLPDSFSEGSSSSYQSDSRSSVSSFTSENSSAAVDSDSEYSPETQHSSAISGTRPLPSTPRTDYSEEGITDSEPSFPPPTLKRANTPQSRRTTMSSVWSQDSAYTTSQPPDVEAYLAYQQLVPNAIMSGMMQGNQASINSVLGKQVAPAGPRVAPTRRRRPVKAASKLSVRFAQALKSPKSPRGFTMVFAPNDSAV